MSLGIEFETVSTVNDSEQEMAFLSIVTPTYNRAHTLPKCYDSLRRQTCMDFEWIIVDDGSSDDTRTIIDGFSDDLFPITKLCKENGGKHTALNYSHPYIHGEYVLILDSDDYLTDTAVEEALKGWQEFDCDEIVGVVTFFRGKSKEKPLCMAEKYDTPVDFLPLKRHIIISSDCCEVIRARLFLKYPFPVFPKEKFIAECALWNRVGQQHKCVYINSVICICEYMEGGLTKSGRRMRIKNPIGGMFTSNLRMDRRNDLAEKLKNGVLYTCYGCFAHKRLGQQIKESDHPLLVTFCFPLGAAMYFLWKRKYWQ